MKIAILGIYPPPIGGISIYIKRFYFFLSKKGINKVLYNSGKYANKNNNIINVNFKHKLFKLIFDSSDIIHSNEIGIKARMIIPLFKLFNKKTILSIHGDSFKTQITELKGIKRACFLHQIKSYDHIIAVNPNIKLLLILNGINKSQISVISAFIPPTPDETDINHLPEFFHKIRKRHKFLITANAFKISFYNNEDLYGIDLSIELMNRLVQNGYKNIGFIYVIPDIGNYDYYEKMQNLVKKYNLEDNFHFYTNPVAYPAVINMCDLFIRPTNTDGDALSIREALTLKKPAIASDVCKRPEGTILFKSKDIEELYVKTTDVINNYEIYKAKTENIKFADNAERILEEFWKYIRKS